MGAAQSSMRPAGVVLPVSYLGELGNEIQYEKSMGSSRFLKSIKARHRAGALVIKVFVKVDSHMDLRPTSKRIAAERAALSDCPNVLPYSQALATERAGYLIRQWLSSSLYDRISTRPFLSSIEKKWIAFQLLTALKDVHARKVSHGDIKSENVLVTSWNWAYLTDFSSAFKPTYIPEDDPSDFSYFFDTSGRRTCYLAPERFYSPDSEISRKKAALDMGRSLGRVTEAMDVFSLGCVVAELFMEGSPPFTLAQLLQYRTGEYSLEAYLAQIEDQDVRSLLSSMTSLNPKDRLSCEQYCSNAYDQLFPATFYNHLYDFMASMNDVSTEESAGMLPRAAQASISGMSTPQANPAQSTLQTGAETDSQLLLPTNADEIVGRIWSNFEQLERHLGSTSPRPATLDDQPHLAINLSNSVFPVWLPSSLDTYGSAKHAIASTPSTDGPAVIVLSLLCANIRNCSRPSSILRACDLLLALSPHLTDETKLDRLLPFIVALLQNDTASVRAAALRTLAQTLASIDSITPANAAIFPQYIFPNVLPLASDSDELVRGFLAQSLTSLAESAQWYLDMTQAMKAEGTFKLTRAHDFDGAPYEMSYDASLLDLQGQVQEVVHVLLTDTATSVRRAVVLNITPMCAFLGRARTADILSLLTTHLNDRDWRLRTEFFGSMIGVSTCISVKGVDEYILPLLTGALADPEEHVTARELNTLTTLTSLGLHHKKRLWDSLLYIIPLLCHPNVWIRSGATSFIAAASRQIGETERWCTLYPALRRVLQAEHQCTSANFSYAQLSRPVYESAVAWAQRSPQSPFWVVKDPSSSTQLGQALEARSKPPSLSPEDKAEFQKMHSLGMTEGDSFKLLSLRAYIAQIAASRKNSSSLTSSSMGSQPDPISFTEETMLANHGVIPQNIIFSTTDKLGARFPSRSSLIEDARSNGFADDSTSSMSGHYLHGRVTGARSVSGSSTADALRKRLAMSNLSSSSLNNMAGAAIPGHNGTPNKAQVPTSPASVVNSDLSTTKGDIPTSSSPVATSSALSALHRQRSKVNANGVEVSKVTAAVGEDTAFATGHLTSEAGHEAISQSGRSTPVYRTQVKMPGARFSSTYEGNDPAIKQLLDRVYLDSYREPMPEFGPFIPDKVAKKRLLRPGARDRLHKSPEGLLFGHLAEHSGAITSIAVSPDHLFFATGSADGTVKIWDTTRLEKNVTSRSRQTITQGGRITSVVALENSHCIASASSNGTIRVDRVDVQQQSGQMPRYGKVANVRHYSVDSLSGDYATSMLHYDTDSASKLLYGTMESNIVILDVRTLRVISSYQQPAHLGPISCLCLDRHHSWLLTGTLQGFLTLWDLRFGLLLRTWKAGRDDSGAVQSCSIHSTKGKGRWVIVTLEGSEGSFETWDIGTFECVERYIPLQDTTAKDTIRKFRRQRASSADTVRTRLNREVAAASDVNPAQAVEALLFHATPPVAVDVHQDEGQGAGAALYTHKYRANQPAVKVIINGADYGQLRSSITLGVGNLPSVSEGGTPTQDPPVQGRLSDLGWIMSAGEDKRLVFWDLAHTEKSSVITGPDEGEERAVYAKEFVDGTTLFTATRQTVKSGSTRRSNLMATGQQNLLKAHQDAITTLALLELPFRCVVSGDRSGVIKVWE